MKEKNLSNNLEKVSVSVIKNGEQEDFEGTIHRMEPGKSLGLQRECFSHLMFAGLQSGIYQIKNKESGEILYFNDSVLEAYAGREFKTDKERKKIMQKGMFFPEFVNGNYLESSFFN